MLPDFPEAKSHARRAFLRAVRDRIPQHEPLLKDIGHTCVHEGRSGLLTRQDQSTDEIRFEKLTVELDLSREQMRRITVEALLEHVGRIAEELAEQQAKLMFSRLSKAAEEVGNVVSTAELDMKEAFLEMQRRVELDFDLETLQPKNAVLVMHPDQAERFLTEAKEWENDPIFTAEMRKIRQQQIENWRARENRRTLVD